MSDVGSDVGAQYMAYREAVTGGSALDRLMQGGGAKPTEGAPAPNTPPPSQQGWRGTPMAPSGPANTPQNEHSLPVRAVLDISKGVFREAPRAIVTGIGGAIQNSVDAADNFGKWIADKTGLPEGGAVTSRIRSVLDKKYIEDPKSVTGGLIKGTTQFLTGLALTRNAMGSVGLPAQVGGAAGYGYAALQGAAANFMAFDPHQQRLSNLIEQFPVLSNPITRYLESKPGDTEAEGRFKNALEGTGLGVLADGLLKGIKLLRHASDVNVQAGPQLQPAGAGVDDASFKSLGDEAPNAPLVSDKPFSPPGVGETGSGPPKEAESALLQFLKQQHASEVTSHETPESVVQPEAPAGKPQTYINFARIDTPEDVQQTMQQLADRFSGSIKNAQRGTQTFEQIKLNSEMENAWDLLQNRRVGEPLNAEQSVAARQLWASSADKVRELAQNAITSPTEANLFAFRKMMATHYAIQSEVIGARTETARALSSWRIPVGSSAQRLQDITERMMDFSGGMQNVKQMAQFVVDRATANQPYELERFMEKGQWARSRDAMLQAFTDSLLSSPVTQTKILASNISTAAWRVAERATAEKLGGGVAPGEAVALYQGWMGGFKDAFSYAGKALKSGMTGEGIGEPHEAYPSYVSSSELGLDQQSVMGKAADMMGGVLQYGFGMGGRRLIAAQHDMALTMAYRGELNALAYRQGYGEGLRGLDLQGRMAELLQDPPEALVQAARESAKYQAFLNNPNPNSNWGKLTNWMLEGRQAIPAMRLVAPFIKIPSNILAYTFERTPFAPVSSAWRADIAAGGARADLAMAQMGLGSMIFASAADMTLSGQMRAGGFEKPGLEQAEQRLGKSQDSIKVGNHWFNINGVHPIGKLMLLAGDVAQNLSDGQDALQDPDKWGRVISGTIMAIGRTLVDSSYFQGMANLFAALHDANVRGSGVGSVLQAVGSAVPQAVAAVQRASDPYQRAVYSMMDEIKSKVPGLSKTLPPKLNLWGEPVPSGHDPMTNLLSPVKITDEKDSPIDKEIERLGLNLEMPDRQQHFGIPGNEVAIDMAKYPQLYARLLQLSGHELKEPYGGTMASLKDTLDQMVTGKSPLSSVYNIKSDSGKGIMIRHLVEQYQQAARDKILQEDKGLAQEVQQKGDAQRAIKFGALMQ